MMQKPNLFDWATSELSQDAFICWLLSWADASYKESDPVLHEAATRLLNKFFELHNVNAPKVFSCVPEKQHKKIDVFVRVNNDYVIIIEDKVHTNVHSNQLTHYVAAVEDEEKGIDPKKILKIYFKTGDQSSYDEIKKNGYVPFLRNDFLDILKHDLNNVNINPIYSDYYSHLQGIEDEIESFKESPVEGWKWPAWVGFFKAINDYLANGTWDYVPNPSGGFYGFWWHHRPQQDCIKYLQLEGKKLCFKIEVKDKTKQAALPREWCETLIQTNKKFNLNISKPKKFGKGQWMTAAVLLDDYIIVDKEGKLDLQRTIAFLHGAEKLLDASIDQSITKSA